MPVSNPEIWWTLVFGTLALVLLSGVFIASIVFHQRRYIEVQRQKMAALEKSEQQLRNSRDQLRQLSAHLQSVREEERVHIAREIHDELGQMLTVLKMDLSLVSRKLRRNFSNGGTHEILEELSAMSKLVDTTILSIRRIAVELRPELLDDLGLKDAIEWEAKTFQARTEIKTEFNSSMKVSSLDKEYSTALFRILQEALTNVARHARATEVVIKLAYDRKDLVLEIRDNGRGITNEESSRLHSLGLLGMRERVLLIGGTINITGILNFGTTVHVRVPIAKDEREHFISIPE